MKELFDIENIRERVMSDSAKVCGITSIKKGEGKTYISSLLQESMIQIGDKTLLIRMDGNWETNKNRYADGTVFCVEDVSDFQPHEIDSEKVRVIAFHNFSNFDKFIYSREYGIFLEECKGKYDHILIDMAALSEQSVSKKICELCDDTMIVVSKDAENGVNVRKEIEQLRSVGAKIKGIILNEHSFKRTIFKM